MKAEYVAPQISVWTLDSPQSILVNSSFTSVGVSEYDQAAGEEYYDNVEPF